MSFFASPAARWWIDVAYSPEVQGRATAARPPSLPAIRAYEYWLTVYRRIWRATIASSVLNPVLYLAAMGVGLGAIVKKQQLGLPYLDFVGPGLLAAVAMQVASIESSFPVRAAVKWNRQYYAMLATPLGVGDLVLGHLLYVATRVCVAVTMYFCVLAAFGVLHSWWAALTIPLCVLTGLAFAGPISALSAYTEDEVFNPLFRFIVTPMFLFAGIFFPVTRLPPGLRELAYATPLWNGVDLARHLTLGHPVASRAAIQLAYLALWFAFGIWIARWAYRKRLVT
jgi:lipooligosaccharide transport system permease protein